LLRNSAARAMGTLSQRRCGRGRGRRSCGHTLAAARWSGRVSPGRWWRTLARLAPVMRQALRCRRAKRPAGTGCLPVQADDTARLAGRGTGSRLPGNPGMAGHGHASDRSPPPPEERQPPDRAQPHHLPRLPASFPGPTSNKPRRSRISADRS